jgi:hypothetical protein
MPGHTAPQLSETHGVVPPFLSGGVEAATVEHFGPPSPAQSKVFGFPVSALGNVLKILMLTHFNSEEPQPTRTSALATVTLQELEQIRKGHKLATKFLDPYRQNGNPGVAPDSPISRCSSAFIAEKAVLTLLAGLPSDQVVATMLIHSASVFVHPERYHGLAPINEKEREARSCHFRTVVSQKFSSGVADLAMIEDIATLPPQILKAQMISRLAGLSIRSQQLFTEEIPPHVIEQARSLPCGNDCLSIMLSNELSLYDGLGSLSAAVERPDVKDAVKLVNALRAISVIYKDESRAWGPNEKIPLTAHQCEVGLILLCAGASVDEICAGFLHDLYEGYSKFSKADTEYFIKARFGNRVNDLVLAVTEELKSDEGELAYASAFEATHGRAPSKSEIWLKRKSLVMEQILNIKDPTERLQAAQVMAAAKISTFAAGAKWLYANKGDITGWSKAGLAENVLLGKDYLRFFKELGVNKHLTAMFQLELHRLELYENSQDRTQVPRYSVDQLLAEHPNILS